MSDQSKATFEPDDRSEESLVERLRHPAFSYSDGDCFLDEEITVNDMTDAADEIERLRAQLASARQSHTTDLNDALSHLRAGHRQASAYGLRNSDRTAQGLPCAHAHRGGTN